MPLGNVSKKVVRVFASYPGITFSAHLLLFAAWRQRHFKRNPRPPKLKQVKAELLATANVTKKDGSYFLALSIQNIFDNNVVQSESDVGYLPHSSRRVSLPEKSLIHKKLRYNSPAVQTDWESVLIL